MEKNRSVTSLIRDPRRGDNSGSDRLVIVVIVLSVVGTIIAVGPLQRPLLRDIVLTSDDMKEITGVGGKWTQSILMFNSSEEPQQGCISSMIFFGNNSPLAITIWIMDMESAIGAVRTYDGLLAEDQSMINSAQLEIGDECVLAGTFAPEDSSISVAALYFHQGGYCVRMLFNGDLATRDLCIGVAQAQASRL